MSVSFTEPYVLIEGVYAVPVDSDVRSAADADRAGTRVGVKQGSAYDLSLTRELEHATVVRGDEGTKMFEAEGLDVAAGIRAPLTAYVATRLGCASWSLRLCRSSRPWHRRDKQPTTVAFLGAFVEDLKASGFVERSLKRSGLGRGRGPPRERNGLRRRSSRRTASSRGLPRVAR